MASEPTEIDTSRLDQLATIAAEQAGLRALSDKARALRDRAIEVCERVVRDYQGRIASLEEQARALGDLVRRDLATLNARHDEARQAVERLRIEQQEVDFRYEIGEIAKPDYPDRRKAIDDRLAAAEHEFERVEALKRRFTEALAESSVPARTTPADQPGSADADRNTARPADPQDPVAAQPTVRRAEAVTFLPTPNACPPQRPGTGASGPAAERVQAASGPATPRRAPLAAEQGSTISIAPALLREEAGSGAPGATHHLGFLTTIGRTPDNHIAVAEAEVSRHHARITLSEKGFVLEDLNSGNGTFLNGERSTGPRLLADGDRVGIGSRTFVFKVQAGG